MKVLFGFVGLFAFAASACAADAPPQPTEKDLSDAQAAHHRLENKLSPDAFAACNGFTAFQVVSVSKAGLANVKYEEYRSDTEELLTRPMSASLAFKGGKWIWENGTPPRCAYAIIDIDLNPSEKK